MNKPLILLISTLIAISAQAQDYIESFTHNKDYRGADRVMQYTPTANGYLASTNGKNLYTRALYGGHSLWRLETSDMPIFAAYHKKDNRNIHFVVSTEGVSTRLDSVADCTALYAGGERIYHLSDPEWGNGSLQLTALACHDREGAIWQIKAVDMPLDAAIEARVATTVKVKLNRSGDMGADPANAFAPDSLTNSVISPIGGNRTVYILYEDRQVTDTDQKALKSIYYRALDDTYAIAGRIMIDTPDPYINVVASCLTTAGDGIWDGQTYQHGAIGWRMPLSGWRGAYTGDFQGYHDRARTHFDAYAASQVTDVPPTIAHPTQDPTMGMARAEKKWGTQMYSNGYICRNPERNDQMHHYDMDLCYIDELLWHLQWTGDTAYARTIWPVIKSALDWEKRNYDPDGDHLYDAYCCIWASDALYYNSGGVTHSSAYNYRANKLAAKIADLLGEDPTPYLEESQAILAAINDYLWMDDRGVWAEFVESMGEGRQHTHPGLWTVYHAIDSETATPQQAYLATRYIDNCIPHIAVDGLGVPEGEYATISTTDWLPYAWSINNVAFAEVYHTALAYYQAGRPEAATRLLKSAMLDGMFLGNSPGNIGQISHYDAARGESYRDFADPVGVLSRTLVQGLYGFAPDMLHRAVNLRPGFPADWDHASIIHPDFDLSYTQDSIAGGIADNYTLRLHMAAAPVAPEIVRVTLPVKYTDYRITAAGQTITPHHLDKGKPWDALEFEVKADSEVQLTVEWSGQPIDDMPIDVQPISDIPDVTGIDIATGTKYTPVDLTDSYNSNITDIFRNRYLSPRSPYTTLQIPVQGIGEWCHPNDTAHIDDAALRAATGTFTIPAGVPFATPASGKNVVYVSLFDNYPDSVAIPLSGSAKAIDLLMAGSTNHMQAYIENADITVTYTDGTTTRLSLVPPYNWAPIEQVYFTDGKAFDIPTPAPQRIALKTGLVSDDLSTALNIDGVYGRRVDGGAGILLSLPLDPDKQLESLRLQAHSTEVVIGLIAATLVE